MNENNKRFELNISIYLRPLCCDVYARLLFAAVAAVFKLFYIISYPIVLFQHYTTYYGHGQIINENNEIVAAYTKCIVVG